MREIKFRAWDKELLKWSDTPLDYKISDINGYTDYEWCQYTGLKDKNGVEIYEGYICEVDVYTNYLWSFETVSRTYEVEFIRGAFRLLRNNKGTSIHFDKTKSYKVIGNIYENPELMEG